MYPMQTFYRTDGSELRVRALVEVPATWCGTAIDYADVTVSTSGYTKLVRAMPVTWGNGRFAPVRKITQA
jgi:hypothetical protein